MEEAKKQLAEWDEELDQLHTRNGDLGLEAQNLTEQLVRERDDRKEIERQLSELKQNSAPTATTGHLYQEIENLKERNRLLLIKSREERQKLQEELTTLKYRDESQSRRLQEKQAQFDELEIQLAELRSELSDLRKNSAAASRDLPEAADLLNQLKAKRKKPKADLADLEAILEILEG